MPNNMSRFARSIRIGAPPADVWAAIRDVEAWPTWASQFKRLERLEASPPAVGSRVRVTPKGMPGAVRQVTEYEEGKSFTWVVGHRGSPSHDLDTRPLTSRNRLARPSGDPESGPTLSRPAPRLDRKAADLACEPLSSEATGQSFAGSGGPTYSWS
jgi:uncharacterized protein YndB with AHSA1/START domain